MNVSSNPYDVPFVSIGEQIRTWAAEQGERAALICDDRHYSYA